MTRINTKGDVVTLVNVFTVAPERQQALIDLLIEATNETMRHQPGYVSANIHRSHDGVRVVNYAQWRTEADFQAMLTSPDAQAHFRQVNDVASSEPHTYEVVFTDESTTDLHA